MGSRLARGRWSSACARSTNVRKRAARSAQSLCVIARLRGCSLLQDSCRHYRRKALPMKSKPGTIHSSRDEASPPMHANLVPIVIEQTGRGVQGQATDIDIQAREIIRLREQMNNILVKHTGQSLKKIEKDTDRDLFLTGKQAVEYGLVDEVIVTRPGKLTKT